MRIISFEFRIIYCICLIVWLAFIANMSYQYRTCTRGDYESSAHDWCARKEEIGHRFKLEYPKFDNYCDSNIFSDWLADMERYFNWYRLPEVTRLLFARRKLIGSANSYWTTLERDCVRHGVVIILGRNKKKSLRKSTFPNIIEIVSYKDYTTSVWVICQSRITQPNWGFNLSL